MTTPTEAAGDTSPLGDGPEVGSASFALPPGRSHTAPRPSLLGCSRSTLAELLGSATRAKAVWTWLRERPLEPLPDTLAGCGHRALEALRSATRWPSLAVTSTHTSADGTTRWTLDLDGRVVETVLIPTATRATVCVSVQSGCTRYCEFCATARMGYRGAVDAGGIVAQVLLARKHSAEPITNVVMMGMGEPLDNLDHVLGAIMVLDEGLLISPRHVTVSTSGVLPKMERLWRESRASLALSLHATTQALRDELMPKVARYPLSELTAWMRDKTASDPRHVFIEYTLLAGVNDHDEDADRLAALLTGVRCRINLIPFNASPGIQFRRPSKERVLAFRDRLIGHGYLTLVRETRGDDGRAACGQLAVSLSSSS